MTKETTVILTNQYSRYAAASSQGLDSRTHLNLRYPKNRRFGTGKFKLHSNHLILRTYHVILRNGRPHFFCLFLYLQDSGYYSLKVY